VYEFGKVLYNVAGIQLMSIANPQVGKELWDEYTAPLTNIINVIKNGNLSARDIVKGVTHFAVRWKTDAKLLEGLGKLCNVAKTKALAYAQQNPSAKPREYVATPEGLLLEAAHNLDHPDVLKNNLIQKMGSEQKIGEHAKKIVYDLEQSQTLSELGKSSRLSTLDAAQNALKQIKDIAVIEKEVSRLSTLFNNARKGFAEFANKYIKILYEHILAPDITIFKDGKVEFSGFHHDLGGAIEKSGLVKFANKVDKGHGFYQADVAFHGVVRKQKTFFPQDWSREKVINKVLEVYDNFLASGKAPKLIKNGKYEIMGGISEGYDVLIHITKTGEMTSAYPVFPKG
jgi:hypothetical protein